MKYGSTEVSSMKYEVQHPWERRQEQWPQKRKHRDILYFALLHAISDSQLARVWLPQTWLRHASYLILYTHSHLARSLAPADLVAACVALAAAAVDVVASAGERVPLGGRVELRGHG